MRRGVIVLLLAIPLLAGCGSTGRPPVHSAAHVRRVFAEHGIHLDGQIGTEVTWFNAVIPGATALPAQPPYRSQQIPVVLNVEVYSTIDSARQGNFFGSTVGSSSLPPHRDRARNVVVEWHGDGGSRLAAAIRELR